MMIKTAVSGQWADRYTMHTLLEVGFENSDEGDNNNNTKNKLIIV